MIIAVAVVEGVLGQRPAGRPGAAGDPAGGRGDGAGRVDGEHDRQRGPGPAGLLGVDPGAALGRGAEVLGDEQPARGPAQRGAELGGPCSRAGEHRDLGVRAAGGGGAAQRPAVRADDQRVVPGQAGAGEGEGHRRHGRVHLGPQPGGAQRPQHAEQAGVAAGEHHRVTPGGVVRGDRGDRGRHVAHDHGAGRSGGQGVEVPAPAGDQAGLAEPGGGLGAQRPAVHAHDADHATQPGSVAATTRAPAGSTRATRAGSPAKRVSTSATRAHSASPQGRSTPAASHSSYACRAVLAAATCSRTGSGVIAASTDRSTLLRV